MAWNPTSYHSFECPSTYQEDLPYGNFAQEYQYEDAERYQSWDPTSYQRFEGSPTYQEDPSYEDFVQGYNYGYDEVYQSWDMEYEHGMDYYSPNFNEEEILNNQGFYQNQGDQQFQGQGSYSNQQSKEDTMEQILKQGLESTKEMFSGLSASLENLAASFSALEKRMSQRERDAEKTYEEDSQTKDEFLQEDIMSEGEVEAPLVYNVDENLEIRYEEQVYVGTLMIHPARSTKEEEDIVVRTIEDSHEDGLVFGCIESIKEISMDDEFSTKEEMHIQTNSKQETKSEVPKEKQESLTEEISMDGEEEKFQMVQLFDKHLGITSSRTMSIDGPRKIYFEEIRMKEFRGWFYDEYDPGDPRPCHIPNQKK